MKKIFLLSFVFFASFGYAQKTIHVYVALCDNENQGIVPVSKTLGNGQNPNTNLYWGALYGVKTHLKKSKDWIFIKTLKSKNPQILDRALFKHATTATYLLAEAYDGKYIKNTTIDFLESLAGNTRKTVLHKGQELVFGGKADLVSYIGHDGLMEFRVKGNFTNTSEHKRDAIILACISKRYFAPYVTQTKANPLVWSTGLMSPEAYTLAWALEGWIKDESNEEIRLRAAKAYDHYQKCGLKGAKRLLVTGY